DRLAVHVTGDVRLSFVPNVATTVLPTVAHEQWVERRPTQLGPPEPERRRGPVETRPVLDVRFVPLDQGAGRRWVPGEAANTVRAVRNDDRWRRPFGVPFEGIGVV